MLKAVVNGLFGVQPVTSGRRWIDISSGPVGLMMNVPAKENGGKMEGIAGSL
jgi:hypothetical protein